MDENTKRMMERLKADPAALRRLMQSRDGQTLMQALTRPANAVGRPRAVPAAMRRDTHVMSDLVGLVPKSPEGAALMERISRSVEL